jgi:hypothetical protein
VVGGIEVQIGLFGDPKEVPKDAIFGMIPGQPPAALQRQRLSGFQ